MDSLLISSFGNVSANAVLRDIVSGAVNIPYASSKKKITIESQDHTHTHTHTHTHKPQHTLGTWHYVATE